jgi:adenine-specific DNA-methyltransferase
MTHTARTGAASQQARLPSQPPPQAAPDTPYPERLLDQIEALRLAANGGLDADRRGAMGQFMTPAPTARLMAGLFDDLTGDIRLLDAGAGVGSLTAATVEEACNRPVAPRAITASTYELEAALIEQLRETHRLCKQACAPVGVAYSGQVYPGDFIETVTAQIRDDLFSRRIAPQFNRIILNPPYKKIHSQSQTRKLLRSVGIETTNLYAAFVALSIHLLEDGGELVAITPRSFCNGPYFKPFRQLLFESLTLKQIHLFHTRNRAFRGDNVLQENIIFHAVKTKTRDRVLIASSTCAEDPNVAQYAAQQETVCNPNDPDRVIHILTSREDAALATQARSLPCTLEDLDIQVSTGRVVDFRAREFLRAEPGTGSVPLIYPCHFKDGFVEWPNGNTRKPNALADGKATADLRVPSGIYVLTKRFTAKEERRRVVAVIHDPQRVRAATVGFENHLNYFHTRGNGLTMPLAGGLALFLNSTLVDQYFRQFNGHTQVNATDLRSLRYPSVKQLKQLGNRFRTRMPDQDRIDAIIEATLFTSD